MRNNKELVERWWEIYYEYKEDLSLHGIYYLDSVKNAKLDFSASWSLELADMGRFEYLLNKDIILFKHYIRSSILVYEKLVKQYYQEEGVPHTYITMRNSQVLFEALAIGDFQLAKDFAKNLKITKGIINSPSITYLGYTLKHFVQDTPLFIKVYWLKKFISHCPATKKPSILSGYRLVLESILEKDIEKANIGFKELVKGHEKECELKDSDRYFRSELDEDICIWGIGLANLAISYGLNVVIEDPLIPQGLLTKL